MKIILALTLAIISVSTIFSQTDEETVSPKNYLGEINGQQVYYTGLSHIRTNHIILYTIENELISELGEISLTDDRLEQIFVFENQIYGLTSDLKESSHSFIKFDNRYKETERIEIMSYAENLKSPPSYTPDHRIRIITHLGKALITVTHYKVRTAVIDFKLMKSEEYSFDAPGASYLEPSDALFFDETDAHVIYEYSVGNTAQTRPKYVSFVNGKTNYFDLNDYIQDYPGIATSFRFIRANNENYLISLLFHKTAQIGFTITKINDVGISEIKLNKVINEKLNDPSLWCEKNYEHWKQNPMLQVGQKLSKLDEVHLINNQLILSVRNYAINEPISNIMISSVNIENEQTPLINWNVMTHNGVFNNSSYYYNQFCHEYVLAKYENHIRLFYNCDKSKITEKGEVIKKREEPNFNVKISSIAIIDIDLKDGSSRFIANPYAKQEINYSTTSPYYSIIKDNIYIISEILIPYGPKISIKERKYHYKPTLLIFPIDPNE